MNEYNTEKPRLVECPQCHKQESSVSLAPRCPIDKMNKIFTDIPIQVDPRINKNMTHCLICKIELKLIDIEDKDQLNIKICQKCNRIYVLGE